MTRWLSGLGCSWVVAAAACHPPKPTARATDDAVVYLTSGVGEAQVYVDGNVIGTVASLAKGFAIDPGRHRVELRHDDYFSRYAELALRRSQTVRLQLDMVPILP